MSDFDIKSSISVTDDELRQSFDDDLKALKALADQAKRFGGDAADAFREAADAQRELMDQVGATGAQYGKLRSLIDDVNAKVEAGGGISHNAAIGAGELARGFGRIAQSGNLSAFALREFTGAAFRLGDSLGSTGVGAGVGIAVIALGGLIEYLDGARKKADALAQAFARDMEQIAHSASLEEVSRREQLLFSGDQFAQRGSVPGESDVAFLARSQGLQGLRDRAEELNREIAKASANPMFSGGTGGGGRNVALENLEAQLKEVNDEIGKQGQLWSQAEAQRQRLNATEEAAARIRLQQKQDKLDERSVAGYHNVAVDAAARETKATHDLVPELINEHDVLVALQNQIALYRYELEHLNLSAEQRIQKTKQLAEAEKELEKETRSSVVINGERLNLSIKAAPLDKLSDKQEATSIKQQFRDIAREWRLTVDSMTNTSVALVDGILKGTQTLGTTFHNLWADMELGAINAGVRVLAHHIAVELGMTEATATGTATRSDLDMFAAAKKVAMNAWAAITSIGNYAWEAIAATWAAISAIPVIGPFLAPAMAFGAGAELLSLVGNIRSAAGGYDIPAGVNPFTQLHAQEMVLPAELANKVRGMAGGGSGDVHLHLHTPDVDGARRFLMGNRSALGDAVAQAIKDNHTALRKAVGSR